MLEQQEQAKVLGNAGIRATGQRLALANLLFIDGKDRHITAEDLYSEANKNGATMSLATVYNTLHRFTDAGLLTKVLVEPERIWFDTNTNMHHHLYDEDTGKLTDIPAHEMTQKMGQELAGDKQISRIDLVIRVRAKR